VESSEATQVLYPVGEWEENDSTCDCCVSGEFWGWIFLTSGTLITIVAFVLAVLTLALY
jgi:hypothetical protein